MPLTHDTLQTLLDALEPHDVSKGLAYARQRRVKRITYTGDGIEALVKGSQPQPYVVSIYEAHQPDDDLPATDCSCPVGSDCKHVAATLFEALDYTDEPRTAPAPPMPAASEHASQQVRHWLSTLDAPLPPEPKPQQDVLGFRLSLERQMGDDGYRHYVTVGLGPSRMKKNGALGKPNVKSSMGSRTSLLPPYATEDDRELVARMWSLQKDTYATGQVLQGPRSDALLEDLIKTGRAFAGNGTPLVLGEPRQGSVRWLADDTGAQHPGFFIEDQEIDLWLLHTPFYCLRNQVGRLTLDLAPRTVQLLVRAPSLEPTDAPHVRKALEKHGAPVPQVFRVQNHNAEPRPRIKLSIDERLSETLPSARLAFDYPEIGTVEKSGQPTLYKRDGDVVHVVRRDRAFEDRARERLRALGLVEVQPWNVRHYFNPDLHGALAFPNDKAKGATKARSDKLVTKLREDGWQIDIDPSYPFQDVREITELTVNAEPRQDNAWFDVALGIEVEGHKVALLPILVRALRSLDGSLADKLALLPDLPLTLPHGGVVKLGKERLESIMAVILALYDGPKSGDTVPLSQWDMITLAPLLPEQRFLTDHGVRYLRAHTQGAKTWPKLGKNKDLVATLRDYQEHGARWLALLSANNQSGVLADDMGLGKTVQAIAHLVRHRGDVPSLIVAPTSLLPNWKDELTRFAPSLRVLTLHGGARHEHFDRIASNDVVLTSYPLLVRDQDKLAEVRFMSVVFDEAQALKNATSQVHAASKRLQATQRLALTGTPLENHLGELWSLFDVVAPGLLGTARSFKEKFRSPIEQHKDALVQKHLVQRVQPFLLRRTKDEVAPELPPKTEIIQHVELGGAQRDLYESVRVSMEQRVRDEVARLGTKRSSIVVLDALLKLRQICCDPRLTKLAAKKQAESAKLEVLFELLPSLIEDGRRILLFSQFTSMLALIAQELDNCGMPYVTLTGDTTDRKTPVRDFQSGDVPLFLLSLKAGGTGLNLTAADTVIHYDPWWNPAVEAQATDRAHRIGQDKPVFVYKLVARGSVEERMLELQNKKRALVKGVLAADEGKSLASLSESEIQSLFAPL